MSLPVSSLFVRGAHVHSASSNQARLATTLSTES
ncbi:hypothetical protein [Sporisorium scitamineum]|uniref:Uncharacterized protein n=1 Tax=Sporisorium scitamineum TaxID=49012 RepID=A0A0F7S6X5_9BASI|nr:hypothetical protein [Sporisorium scitamineum]